ncbi:MAG: NAD/NADP octopine/nopaline dehydrogenase family protein [Chloroflexota bacterium]|nr:NAD/NADP octopine/nopaline dehydrogenase family protein [Chloroflexota bacterium]
MTAKRITILGAGNTGFSLAANLALAGHEVLLWEHPAFASAIEPLRDSLTIQLDGAARTGEATLAAVTTDARQALAWTDLLLAAVPSYAHAAFAEQIVPELRAGHLLALLPGNLGTLAFKRALEAAGTTDVTLVESDTAPYVCRKTGPRQAVIWGSVPAMGIGVLPTSRTEDARDRLAGLFRGIRGYPNVLAAGLSALNPIVHPAGVLLNAGRIERSRGEFWFYEEGVTPAVVAAIESLDLERLAIGAAFGLQLTPVAQAFHEAGFGPAGDLWAVINGSRMLTALRAPGAIDTRWLTEDVPYGLVTWAALATVTGVHTPMLNAVVTLASAVLGIDFRASGRSLADLGLDRLPPAAILAHVNGSANDR